MASPCLVDGLWLFVLFAVRQSSHADATCFHFCSPGRRLVTWHPFSWRDRRPFPSQRQPRYLPTAFLGIMDVSQLIDIWQAWCREVAPPGICSQASIPLHRSFQEFFCFIIASLFIMAILSRLPGNQAGSLLDSLVEYGACLVNLSTLLSVIIPMPCVLTKLFIYVLALCGNYVLVPRYLVVYYAFHSSSCISEFRF